MATASAGGGGAMPAVVEVYEPAVPSVVEMGNNKRRRTNRRNQNGRNRNGRTIAATGAFISIEGPFVGVLQAAEPTLRFMPLSTFDDIRITKSSVSSDTVTTIEFYKSGVRLVGITEDRSLLATGRGTIHLPAQASMNEMFERLKWYMGHSGSFKESPFYSAEFNLM
jgi:hypothetical protein